MGDPFVLIDIWIRRIMFLLLGLMVLSIDPTLGFASSSSADLGWQSTDSYRIFNFIVLALGLFLLLRKSVKEILDNRIEDIKVGLEDLKLKKSKIKIELAEYDVKLAKLDTEKEDIISEYLKQAEENKTKIVLDLEVNTRKFEEQAKKNIEFEFVNAKNNLKFEIMERALIKAEGLIKKKINAQDHKKLFDDYLKKVVA